MQQVTQIFFLSVQLALKIAANRNGDGSPYGPRLLGLAWLQRWRSLSVVVVVLLGKASVGTAAGVLASVAGCLGRLPGMADRRRGPAAACVPPLLSSPRPACKFLQAGRSSPEEVEGWEGSRRGRWCYNPRPVRGRGS